MTKESRQDAKFYASLALGFGMFLLGVFIPPIGYISNSVLMAGGMLLTIAAGLIGVDITKILKELRLLRDGIHLTNEERKQVINDLTEKPKEKE